ncbi:MAG: DUF1778 domain-containing protein [Anaerovoracaceae bacterium]|jgi:uncharacterized protein (DUF1778 family)
MAEAKKFNQTEYQDEYNREHYDRIQIRVPKGEKEIIKNAAKVAGQSVNEFVVRAVRNSIKKANLEK